MFVFYDWPFPHMYFANSRVYYFLGSVFTTLTSFMGIQFKPDINFRCKMHKRTAELLQKKQVRVQLPTSAVNVTLLAFAAEHRAAALLLLGARRSPLSIDISCPHGAQQQTCHMLWSTDDTDTQTNRRMDGRTLDRYIDPALHTMRPVSRIN